MPQGHGPSLFPINAGVAVYHQDGDVATRLGGDIYQIQIGGIVRRLSSHLNSVQNQV